MTKPKRLTKTAVDAIKAPAPKTEKQKKHGARLWTPDPEQPGFGVRVTSKGTKTYVLRTRLPRADTDGDGRKKKRHAQRLEIGRVGEIDLADARQRARDWLKLIKAGKDPRDVEANQRAAQADKDARTVNAVLDAFVKRHASKLRSVDQVKHAFDSYVRPRLGDISIYDLKRSDIAEMLDDVEDKAKRRDKDGRAITDGKVMADLVLAHLRKAFNWQAARDDDFNSPIVIGMARTKPKTLARKHKLADDEIRDLWVALDSAPDLPACYPAYVKFLLLTATRRNEAAFLHASEIEGDVWTIQGEPRKVDGTSLRGYKTGIDHVIPLSAKARALLGDTPKGFVFSTTGGKKGFSGFSRAKKALDAELAKLRKTEGRKPMKDWTLHDLRRTARSLMSRAKVPTDHAERCMGHVIGGVRETYDRHEYFDEKRAAFEALATLVDMIVNPPADNVVVLSEARQ